MLHIGRHLTTKVFACRPDFLRAVKVLSTAATSKEYNAFAQAAKGILNAESR